MATNHKGNRTQAPWCVTCGNELRALNADDECMRCVSERLHDNGRFGEADDNEPVGSCDNCGGNLYPDDDWDGLCNSCAWHAEQGEQ
ncbi:MAG TPA: hypothetical protein VGE74_04670 [Gemmata sp.]